MSRMEFLLTSGQKGPQKFKTSFHSPYTVIWPKSLNERNKAELLDFLVQLGKNYFLVWGPNGISDAIDDLEAVVVFRRTSILQLQECVVVSFALRDKPCVVVDDDDNSCLAWWLSNFHKSPLDPWVCGCVGVRRGGAGPVYDRLRNLAGYAELPFLPPKKNEGEKGKFLALPSNLLLPTKCSSLEVMELYNRGKRKRRNEMKCQATKRSCNRSITNSSCSLDPVSAAVSTSSSSFSCVPSVLSSCSTSSSSTPSSGGNRAVRRSSRKAARRQRWSTL